MDRLRHTGAAMTEILEPGIVERLLDNLFPPSDVHDPEELWSDRRIEDPDCHVTVDEVISAIRGRKRGGCSAPGPDGLSLTMEMCP